MGCGVRGGSGGGEGETSLLYTGFYLVGGGRGEASPPNTLSSPSKKVSSSHTLSRFKSQSSTQNNARKTWSTHTAHARK